MENNFDIIEDNLRNYKQMTIDLSQKQKRLNFVLEKTKDLRKKSSVESKEKLANAIFDLNKERNDLKTEISFLKKSIKTLYNDIENMIYEGLGSKYSEVYDRQLSRLYNRKVEILYKKIGDLFDNNCEADNVIITHDKSQHAKILKMINYGLKDVDNNRIEHKILVEVCVFSKKYEVGEIIPFDATLFS